MNTTAGIESDRVTIRECVKSQGIKRKGLAVFTLIQSVNHYIKVLKNQSITQKHIIN